MPKQFLKRVERTGFGEFLFYDWAKEPGWDLPPNPILVTGRNFGCGSSREHAPWGLQDYGFRAIIAPTLRRHLQVQLHEDRAAADRAARGRRRARSPRSATPEIDLAAQEVDASAGAVCFEIDPEIKHRLLNGLDDIALTLQQDEAIAAYERDHERSGPVTTTR